MQKPGDTKLDLKAIAKMRVGGCRLCGRKKRVYKEDHGYTCSACLEFLKTDLDLQSLVERDKFLITIMSKIMQDGIGLSSGELYFLTNVSHRFLDLDFHASNEQYLSVKRIYKKGVTSEDRIKEVTNSR
jgi:hypothetical protein